LRATYRDASPAFRVRSDVTPPATGSWPKRSAPYGKFQPQETDRGAIPGVLQLSNATAAARGRFANRALRAILMVGPRMTWKCGTSMLLASVVARAGLALADEAPPTLKPGAYEVEVRLELPHLEKMAATKTATICVENFGGNGDGGLAVLSDNNPLAKCPAFECTQGRKQALVRHRLRGRQSGRGLGCLPDRRRQLPGPHRDEDGRQEHDDDRDAARPSHWRLYCSGRASLITQKPAAQFFQKRLTGVPAAFI